MSGYNSHDSLNTVGVFVIVGVTSRATNKRIDELREDVRELRALMTAVLADWHNPDHQKPARQKTEQQKSDNQKEKKAV